VIDVRSSTSQNARGRRLRAALVILWFIGR
jgi:hypothetical protein